MHWPRGAALRALLLTPTGARLEWSSAAGGARGYRVSELRGRRRHTIGRTGKTVHLQLRRLKPGSRHIWEVQALDRHGRATGRALSVRATLPAGGAPLAVTPVYAPAAAVRGAVSQTGGGTLTATGPDGTTYSLTFPPGAVIDKETVTMTPVAGASGKGIKGLVRGVKLEPEGLRLFRPATLRVHLPTAESPAQVSQELPLGFSADGRAVHLVPLLPQAGDPTFVVTHFSGELLAFGQHWQRVLFKNHAADAEAEIASRLADAIARARDALDHGQTPNIVPALEAAVDDSWNRDAKPLLEQAQVDPELTDAAIAAALQWLHTASSFGTTGKTWEERRASTLAMLATALRKRYETARQKCLARANPVFLETMLQALYMEQILGLPSSGSLSDVNACGGQRVKVDFSEQTLVDPPPGRSAIGGTFGNYFSHVVTRGHGSILTSTYDANVLGFPGSGPIVIDSAAVTPSPTTCTATYSGQENHGSSLPQVSVTASPDLNFLPGQEPAMLVELEVRDQEGAEVAIRTNDDPPCSSPFHVHQVYFLGVAHYNWPPLRLPLSGHSITVAPPPYIPGDWEKVTGTLTISAKQILG